MNRIAISLGVFTALVCALLHFSAYGQTRSTGVLAGRVADPDGAPVPGAVVEISSPALIGGPRTARTDVQGRFRFADLPPGRYDLSAEAAGFREFELEGFSVAVGMTREVPVALSIATHGESVVVRAAPPLIDPGSSSTPTILTADYLRYIPHDRDSSHVLDLAPGINIESAYGAPEESGNSYQVDGVDISDPQGGGPWFFFNTSIINEVQLAGLGAPAEYGQFSGAVFNSVTRSGGNETSGSAELYYAGQAITGNSRLEDLNASIDSDLETTFQLGGPLRRDRLWYFASGQYRHINSTEGGPTQHETSPRVFLKLTAQPMANSMLQGWLEWDHTKVTGRNADEFTPIEATTGEDNPNHVGNFEYNSVVSQNTVFNAAWSGYTGSQRFDPQNGLDLPGHFDAQTGYSSVNAQQFGQFDRNRNQLNASIEHHFASAAGFHDLKAGTEIERSHVHDRYGFPGGAFYSDNEGPVVDPSTGKPDLYTLVYRGGGFNAQATNQRLTLFGQDSWRVVPRLTVNAGIRGDWNRGKAPDQTLFKTTGMAPRIGFAYDVHDDSRTVVRAHYGRYYEALYSSFYYLAGANVFNPLSTERIFKSSGHTEPPTTAQAQQYAVDPYIRQPHMDQVIAGLEQLLPRNIVLAGTLVYRRNADFIRSVSRDGIFVPVQGQVPGTGQTITLYDYLNSATDVLLYSNPRDLRRTYRAAIMSATRPLRDNWMLQASYVYSRAEGNADNVAPDDVRAPGNFRSFDTFHLDLPNALVNAEGRLTHDQTHQVKLQGTRLVPRRHLAFSFDYTYHSGDTWTPVSNCLLTTNASGVTGCHDFPQGPVVYFAERRGSRRLKARNELDVRAEWQHAIRLGVFRFDLDIFNFLNQTRATAVETLVGESLGEPATANFARSIRLGFAVDW